MGTTSSAPRLQRELAVLREREKNKVLFLSMASHDISNSVSTLNAAFEMMASRLRRVNDSGQLADIAANALRQISRMADDLVDWAAMERGTLRLQRTHFGPKEFIEEHLRGFKLRAATKGVNFDIVVESGLGRVFADRKRMGQVLMNLMENALRHTSFGGRVSVGCCAADDKLLIVVRDTGIGMDAATQRRLEEGLSVDKPDGRLGLGLAISRAILARHGGRLWVSSDGYDKGSTFCFTIEKGAPRSALIKVPASESRPRERKRAPARGNGTSAP